MSQALDLMKSVLFLEDPLEYLPQAREIACEERITVYDALYIAQALKYGKLATSDEKQGRVAEKLGVEVTYL
jgi:predicted nucleic acid-binding protein